LDPVEFYHQAVDWFSDTADNRSVTARSIVSRAYYAALLVARDKKGLSGVAERTHMHTVEEYKRGSHKDVEIGNRLDNLRWLRTTADYEMSKTCVRREAGLALKQSRALLLALGVTLPSGSPRASGPPSMGS
jgi:hypothetical protein